MNDPARLEAQLWEMLRSGVTADGEGLIVSLSVVSTMRATLIAQAELLHHGLAQKLLGDLAKGEATIVQHMIRQHEMAS